MPDRIESLLYDLADAARAVPVGTAYHGGGLDGAPVYDVQMAALQLIRAWEEANPAPPTLDDVMAAFIADYPNGHLMVRHDPLRTVGQWTATAYCWRGDGDSPAEAIERLREVVVSNTISVLPALPEGHEWVGLGASGQWQPEAPERIAWQRERNDGLLLFGSPPPLSVVWLVPDYRLYVPVKA